MTSPKPCPKCGFCPQQATAECSRCGIVFAKYRPRSARTAAPVTPTRQPFFEADHWEIPEPEALKALAIGAALAAIILLFSPLHFAMGYLVTLVHEMGHAAAWWLMGSPAIPSFDFTYGGGVTHQYGRNLLLLMALYAAGSYPFFVRRHHRGLLACWLCLLALHLLVTFSSLSEPVALMMGHGTELLFAALCFYRTLSNRGIIIAAERPLYAAIGFFIVIEDLIFATRLMADQGFISAYEGAKGGGHWMDFSRIADTWFDGDLSWMAGLFFMSCLATPVIGYLAFHFRVPAITGILRFLELKNEKS